MTHEEWHRFLYGLCLVVCCLDIALVVILIVLVAIINSPQF